MIWSSWTRRGIDWHYLLSNSVVSSNHVHRMKNDRRNEKGRQTRQMHNSLPVKTRLPLYVRNYAPTQWSSCGVDNSPWERRIVTLVSRLMRTTTDFCQVSYVELISIGFEEKIQLRPKLDQHLRLWIVPLWIVCITFSDSKTALGRSNRLIWHHCIIFSTFSAYVWSHLPLCLPFLPWVFRASFPLLSSPFVS